MKNKYSIVFCAAFIAGCFPLALYFLNFHGGLSANHSTWGEFGSFYGGILGPVIAMLAFIGLLWNLEITKRQFRRQSEDNTFFNLIALHNNKVQMTLFKNSIKTTISGYDAFRKFVEEFKRIYDEESVRIARIEIAKNTRRLSYNAYNFLWKKYASFFHDEDGVYTGDEKQIEKMIALFEKCPDPWELQKGLIGTDDHISPDDNKSLVSIGQVVIEDSRPEERIEIIKRVNDFFYHDFGHLLGHYFRNIYYILKFIDTSEKSSEYSKIFRAQLSRYELTALYYNLISELSGADFIHLIMKYDILNGIYWADICYSPDYEKRVLDLDCILKEKLTKASSGAQKARAH